MNFSRAKKYVEVSNLTTKELFGFFKCKIESQITFLSADGEEVDHIILGERSYVGNTNVITIKELGRSSTTLNYADLIKLVNEKSKTGIMVIRIDIREFKAKESLIVLISDLRRTFIDNCVEIDYNNSVYSVINPPASTGESDKLYYFELNNSVLLFGKTVGPKLIYNKFSSVEEVLCE